MIRYALICAQGHDFEAWFGSGSAFEEQARERALSCPQCGSLEVVKAPMAPAVRRRRAGSPELREAHERKQIYAFLRDLRAHLEANAENVGPAFPEEARKMHYGEAEARSIFGEANLEEARALKEEGIPAIPLPRLPEDHN
jgi:hypothetical protein